jgi:hypothetical protein
LAKALKASLPDIRLPPPFIIEDEGKADADDEVCKLGGAFDSDSSISAKAFWVSWNGSKPRSSSPNRNEGEGGVSDGLGPDANKESINY